MSRSQAWWIAARPHTLWAAVVPVLVGGGLAWGDDAFRGDALAAALVVVSIKAVSISLAVVLS